MALVCTLLLASMLAGASEWAPALDDPDPELRRLAVWSLGREAPGARTASLLAERLSDDDPLTVRYASEALVAMDGHAVGPLLERVLDPRTRHRRPDTLLTEIGPAAVPALIEALEGASDRATATRLATILGGIGPQAAAAVPALSAVVASSENAAETRRLAMALARLGENAAGPTIELWKRSTGPRRAALQGALGALGALAEPAVPGLIEALDPARPTTERSTAAQALGAIGPGARDAVPTLLERLEQDDNASVRSYAAMALGNIGADPERVVPALIARLGESETTLRRRATAGLALFGESALAAVLRSARDDDAIVRAASMAVLRRMEALPRSGIDALIAGTGDEVTEVNEAALLALLKHEERVLDAVIAALGSENRRVRGYAALFCGRRSQPSASVVEPLRAALDDDALRVRQIAAWSLGKQGALAAPAGPDLARVVTDGDDPLLRRNAAWALGTIGRATPEALAALERGAAAEDAQLRAESLEALEKLRGTYGEKR